MSFRPMVFNPPFCTAHGEWLDRCPDCGWLLHEAEPCDFCAEGEDDP